MAKGKYGLKALAHLAALEPEVTTQAIDIAEVNGIPKKFPMRCPTCSTASPLPIW
jgi:DNA-binding IscR family transcriptional regulator